METKLIRVFVASPSDVQAERAMVDSAVNELNRTIGDTYHFRLETKKWENNTFPAIGEYPQAVINKQIGEYEIFVGIMKHKFGSPTNTADSGTEEEFHRAYQHQKENGGLPQLMFFFNQENLPQDIDIIEQFKKVRNFKNKLSEMGVYYKEYKDCSIFESTFRVSLAQYLQETFSTELHNNAENSYQPCVISEQFAIFLNSTGINFIHPSGNDLVFDDIYVPQNLRIIKNDNKSEKRTNIETLSEAIDIEGIRYNIVGEESSGKSSLCKYLFSRYYNQNMYPILINGTDLNENINSNVILKVILNKLNDQYININQKPTENKADNSNFILIIDDFQRSAKGKEKYWKLLVSNVEKLFSNIIIVGDNKLSANDLSAYPPFENFNKYHIMEFGADMRNKLVNKWNSIGLDMSIESKNELRKKNDEANKNIKSILGKNFIPSYPIYILGILQALEAGKRGTENFSLHGFYYEYLINESLVHAVDNRKNIGFYNNFLTTLCYAFFELERRSISVDEFDSFYSTYCEKYDVDNIGKKEAKETLKKTKLLHFDSGIVSCGHKYIYYFFVARYIANNINDLLIQGIIKKLCKRIFKDEYANIIMFVTHLSKNSLIINELIDNANDIFSEYKPNKLEEEISSINNLMEEIPNEVINEIDVEKERNSQLKLEAELEEKQKEFDNDQSNYTNFSLNDDVSEIDLIAKMTLALKSIDILGQIGIKYWGELDSDTKLNVITTAYELGFRTLSLYLNLMIENKDEIIEYLKKFIIDKYVKDKCDNWDPVLNKDKITQSAQNYVIGLSYLSSLAIIKRIAYSVGDENLKPTYDKILNNNPYNSYKLVNLSIVLNQPHIPFDIIKQYTEEMETNKMCHLILRDLVIHHMYRFDTDYKMKAKIGSLNLKIDIKEQRLIQNSSVVKR